MSMMGELKFFLGLQIRQQANGIFHISGEISKRMPKEIQNARFQNEGL